MSSEFDDYIFSHWLKTSFKEYFTNSVDLKVIKADKLNNGLTNVIYKINMDLIYPDKIENNTYILKFYLSQIPQVIQTKEYTILKFLREKLRFVPKPLFYGTHNNIYYLAMEFIKGKSFEDIITNYSIQKQQEIIKNMISFQNDLHKLSIDVVKQTFDENNIEINQIDPIKAYCNHMSDLIKKSKLTEFQVLRNWLEKNKPVSKEFSYCLVHDDFQPYNMIISDTNDVYILDWEGLGIHIAEIDVAWFTFVVASMTNQEMENYILQEYNAMADTSLSKKNLEYYMLLCAGFRLVVFAIILNDIEGVRNSDPTYKSRILNLYRNPIKYCLKRVNEITGYTFPSLEKKL